MNTTPTDEMVLKQDVLGRVKTPKARREQLLDEFERSGVSGQKFAELAGIKYQTLATWIQKRQRQRGLRLPDKIQDRAQGCRQRGRSGALVGGGGGRGPRFCGPSGRLVFGAAFAWRRAGGDWRGETG